MSLSSFPADPLVPFVADASVIINLNATARAPEIVRLLPNAVVITDNAFTELKGGVRNGHRDAGRLLALIDNGLVHVVTLGVRGNAIYEALIEGSAVRTLDDGEAATIAYAVECSGVAILDERKARSICASDFSELRIATTVDLLFHEAVVSAIGREAQIEAVFSALRDARMRVVPDQLCDVVALIGDERAVHCRSLPRMARQGSTDRGVS